MSAAHSGWQELGLSFTTDTASHTTWGRLHLEVTEAAAGTVFWDCVRIDEEAADKALYVDFALR